MIPLDFVPGLMHEDAILKVSSVDINNGTCITDYY